MTIKKTVRKTVIKKAAKVAKKMIAGKVIKVVKKTGAKKVLPKVTKSVVRKLSPKKPARFTGKKPLVYADNQRSFWVSDGQVLNSLIALRDALDAMESKVYKYHAGAAQNDFSVWVSEVLCDSSCAGDLQKAKTTASAKKTIAKHLKSYKI